MAIQTADVIMPGNDNAFETGRRGQISSIAELVIVASVAVTFFSSSQR